MTIIAMSSTLAGIIGDFRMGQKRFDLNEMSDSTGATKTRLLGPPRWQLGIAAPSNGLSLANASEWEATILLLRGGVNHFSAWDINRPLPRGTARGTWTLNGAHSAGATSISIAATGQNLLTLLKGDWFQIGSGLTGQLVKVVADTSFSTSVATVTVEPPLRTGYTGGTAITYNQALAHYKMITDAPQWSVRPGWNTQTGYAIDLMEQWS